MPRLLRGDIAGTEAEELNRTAHEGDINRDNCGSNICVTFEAPIGEPDPYPTVRLDHDYHTMPNIPGRGCG